ncbi:MAG: hypothetical protein Q9M33_01170 [Robiginitomaculum sp.]|nr:hypothetical protein [Robiginitomaculum sp.]
MSGLSQHISEQRFGRRKVRYALRDGVVAAPTVDAQGQNDEAKTLELRFKDGSVCVADAAQWNIDCHPGDVITQVLLSRGKNKPETLAAVINRTRRERQRVEPLQILLRQAGICRSLYWWVSFVFLSIAAIITERGYFARQIASFISDTEARLFSPLRPLWEMISPSLNAAFGWLPMPAWTVQTSASFGSLQDHGAILYVAAFILVLILWSRSLRFITVPLFALLLFILKTRLFGFGSAHGAVLCWYAPVLVLLVFTGLINRYRDRWRMGARLSAICKSQIAQPLSQDVKEDKPSPSGTPANPFDNHDPVDEAPALQAANSP